MLPMAERSWQARLLQAHVTRLACSPRDAAWYEVEATQASGRGLAPVSSAMSPQVLAPLCRNFGRGETGERVPGPGREQVLSLPYLLSSLP